MLIVKLLLHHLSGERLFAYLYLYGRVEGGVSRVDECHADALVCRDGVISGRHLPYLHSVLEHGVSVAGYRLVGEFYAHELPADALRLLTDKGLAADKLLLAELAEDAESGHDRRYVGRKLIAIQRQADLEAQGVSAPQSARLATSARHELVPQPADILVRAVYLEAILAGIAGTAD